MPSQRTTGADMSQASVNLTDRAARRIARILSGEADGTVLRVSVEGGGCSGFQYRYDLVREEPAGDDLVLARDGATVLDRKSTRLNSSHANISYAVFCLKKQNRELL